VFDELNKERAILRCAVDALDALDTTDATDGFVVCSCRQRFERAF